MSLALSSFKVAWISTEFVKHIQVRIICRNHFFSGASTIWLFSLRLYLKNHLSSFDRICWIILINDEFDLTDRLSQIIPITSRLSNLMITSSYPCFWSKIRLSNMSHNSSIKTKHYPMKRLYPSIHFSISSHIIPPTADKLVVACIAPSISK